LPLYDVLPDYPQLRHILVRHEQAAAHAADAYARVTGKVGVCFATSGPGASNLVTGIANAHLDSSPILAVTGQVARPFIGKDAFQEIDITGITVPITKHNHLVLRADEIAARVKEAFMIAGTGRPGPVLLDIPRDVFIEEAAFSYPDKVELPGYKPTTRGHALQIAKAAKAIGDSKRPVIIAGRGVLISRAWQELKELAERSQIPVINTLLGLGSFPEDHELSLGMLGMHGTAYANLAVDGADLVIAIGMRFDDRATGKVSGFAPHAQVIHIDIDPAEIGKNVKVTVPIVGEVRNILRALNKQLEAQTRKEWLAQVDEWRKAHPLHVDDECAGVPPQFVVSKIGEVTGGNAIIATGVGQNQMWAAQHYCYREPNSLVSSGGLGTMGFELPAAIGAKVGRPEKTVWAIAGDGSLQMTIQEMATVVQDDIAVKIAVLNNGYLGMVRQWQELFYDRRYVATPISSPDFVALAKAYGIAGTRVTQRSEVVPAIKKAMKHKGPYLVDFVVEPEENVYPMVAPGSALCEILDDPRKKVKIKVKPRAISNL
jgi:acetolactate synthase-1/2/3 large subunit